MKQFFSVILLSIITLNISNAQADSRVKQFNVEKGVAIQGYDPVAYFTQNKAIKGNTQFVATVEGITYNFYKCCQ